MVNPALHPVHMAVPCLGQAVPVVDAPLSHLHMLTGTHTHRQTTHTHTHTWVSGLVGLKNKGGRISRGYYLLSHTPIHRYDGARVNTHKQTNLCSPCFSPRRWHTQLDNRHMTWIPPCSCICACCRSRRCFSGTRSHLNVRFCKWVCV